jgi:hypothetical protein
MTPHTTDVLNRAPKPTTRYVIDLTPSVTFALPVQPVAVDASANSAPTPDELMPTPTCGPTPSTVDHPRPSAEPPPDDFTGLDLGLLLASLPPEDWNSFAACFIADEINGIGLGPLGLP